MQGMAEPSIHDTLFSSLLQLADRFLAFTMLQFAASQIAWTSLRSTLHEESTYNVSKRQFSSTQSMQGQLLHMARRGDRWRVSEAHHAPVSLLCRPKELLPITICLTFCAAHSFLSQISPLFLCLILPHVFPSAFRDALPTHHAIS
jgi:hypothetical protein